MSASVPAQGVEGLNMSTLAHPTWHYANPYLQVEGLKAASRSARQESPGRPPYVDGSLLEFVRGCVLS